MNIFGTPNIQRLEKRKKIKKLSKLLFSDDERIVDEASKALVNLGELSIPVLISILRIPRQTYSMRQKIADVQQKVMYIMKDIGEPCIEPVLELLNCDWGTEAMAGARVLGIIGHPSAVPHLTAALKSDKWQEYRVLCAESLGKIGGKEALNALLYALENDSFGKVRSASAKALGQIGDPSAIEALKKAFDIGYSEAGVAIDMIKNKNKQKS